ncbi:hypothetical protein PHMEG_0005680 [Phytophthora megakarya]|uniref:Uncharacterized protein n=1 Tax=Phytophthora megakarya TaxID=4795 RepID=A0A225WQV6_9STRA|nr:hypothetical protein PHMEG_0005680 [Phytophthora megakarya]
MTDFDPWLYETKANHNTMQLGAYAVYLWQFGMNRSSKGNTYSTICGKLCAILWYHRSTAGYDPGVNASHAILLRGIHRFSNLYLFIGSKVHSYILRLSAIQFVDKDGRSTSPSKATMVGITLNGAKNNQYGREEVRFHHLSGDKLLCPVRAARWIRRGASAFKIPDDAPALSMQHGGITAENVASTIRRASEERQQSLDSSLPASQLTLYESEEQRHSSTLAWIVYSSS